LAGLRLLIVDDNPTNCRILTLQTRKWGMKPRDSQSATKALEWLRAGESFDLAILDMQMPGMDGVTLAGEIRKLPTGLAMPLVLLTSVGVHPDRPDFANASFAGCLTKPIKPAQLHETLLRVMSRPRRKKLLRECRLTPHWPGLFCACCATTTHQPEGRARLLQQMGYQADLICQRVEARRRSTVALRFDLHGR
jgi:CheY-like chemotaxis protein